MSFPQVSSAITWQISSGSLSLSSQLPQHCEPSSGFLLKLSSAFHTCIPTPLALISTALGFVSIFCWLFAQLPQIIKNYRLRSTSGLSVYFLLEWLLGDVSNVLGAILTQQATWQIIVGSYYCFVDIVLCMQWAWFELLGHGQRVEPTWKTRRVDLSTYGDDDYDDGDMKQVKGRNETKISTATKHVPISPLQRDFFNTPNYGSVQSSSTDNTYVDSRPVTRHTMPRVQNNPIPSPSPRTTLYLTMLVTLASVVAAQNVPPGEPKPRHNGRTIPSLGTILSWCSTVFYLLSRMPQLIKNFARRSTAGLSPLLFLAAFLGNFFYSSSLLCNPSLWHDMPPYGGHGWAGEHGSERVRWALRALPFFLGAAGVLFMDAAVGVQFWLWGGREVERVLEIEPDAGAEGNDTTDEWSAPTVPAKTSGRVGRWSARTTGWMRGWVPSGSPFGSIRGSVSTARPVGLGNEAVQEEQETPLLGGGSRDE